MQHSAEIKIVGVANSVGPITHVGESQIPLAKFRIQVIRKTKRGKETKNIFFVNLWGDSTENIHRVQEGGTYEVEGYFEESSYKDKNDQWKSLPTITNPSITPVGVEAQPETAEEIPF